MIGKQSKEPVQRIARRLGTTAALSVAAAAAIWIAQVDKAARVNHDILIAATFWLLSYGCCAWRIATLNSHKKLVADILTIGALLERRASLCLWSPRAAYSELIARKGVYTWCGYIAGLTLVLTVAGDILVALGALPLQGANFAIASFATLLVASESATVRVIGPQSAAADLAWRQASAVAHADEETRAHWELARGDR